MFIYPYYCFRTTQDDDNCQDYCELASQALILKYFFIFWPKRSRVRSTNNKKPYSYSGSNLLNLHITYLLDFPLDFEQVK